MSSAVARKWSTAFTTGPWLRIIDKIASPASPGLQPPAENQNTNIEQEAHNLKAGRPFHVPKAEPPGVNRMDNDLEGFSKQQLIAEVKKLRLGIREHRDGSGHDLCWYQPNLWGLLPEKTDPLPTVPEWPEFMQGCMTFRRSLDAQQPKAPRTKTPYDS